MIKTMDDLRECFQDAIENKDVLFLAVKIKMEDFEMPEVIINPRDNFIKKLNYYQKAYNYNLELKANTGIKIIDFQGIIEGGINETLHSREGR
jgi:hypothetical protein